MPLQVQTPAGTRQPVELPFLQKGVLPDLDAPDEWETPAGNGERVLVYSPNVPVPKTVKLDALRPAATATSAETPLVADTVGRIQGYEGVDPTSFSSVRAKMKRPASAADGAAVAASSTATASSTTSMPPPKKQKQHVDEDAHARIRSAFSLVCHSMEELDESPSTLMRIRGRVQLLMLAIDGVGCCEASC